MLLETAGFHLLKARWKPVKGRQHLSVVADSEDHNITLGECVELSGMIRDLLDSYPHEFPDYRLEVSSPGLSHPLEKWQFKKNVGRLVEVRYEEDGMVRSCRGELVSGDWPEIAVRSADECCRFDIKKIKQVLVLPLFKRG